MNGTGGDWVFVENGGAGALCANGQVGIVVENNRNCWNGAYHEKGITIKTKNYPHGINLPLSSKIRPATQEEINKAKGSVKIFNLDCTDGSFEIEVNKEGIRYPTDNAWLNIEDLRGAVTNFRSIAVNFARDRSSGITTHYYTFKPVVTHIDSGCKKNVPIEQWKEVLKYFDSLQKD